MFPEFLFQLLRHSFWSGKLAEVAAGTTILHLGQQRAQIFPLMLPPPDEQKRIVEIGSSVDDVIQTSRRAIREAKNLRSGLLSVLLAGVADVY
jgi:type I restriction enzyme S subunit